MAYIQHHGYATTTTNDGARSHRQKVEWQGDYDGEVATLDVNLDKDGQRRYWSATLDNEDLARLLSSPANATPLMQRLVADFPLASRPRRIGRKSKSSGRRSSARHRGGSRRRRDQTRRAGRRQRLGGR